MISFLFEDELGLRRLDELHDPSLLSAIADVRTYVQSALRELSEDLKVIFWIDDDGVLSMTLQGDEDVVERAQTLIGDRAPIPPTTH